MSNSAIQGEIRAKYANLPDWSHLLSQPGSGWLEARQKAQAKGPKVLLATSVGGGTSSALSSFESLLAVALTLRGAHVQVLLCNQDLPACMNVEMAVFPDNAAVAQGKYRETHDCRLCALTGQAIFSPLGLRVSHFRDYLRKGALREMVLRRKLLPAGRITLGRRNQGSINEHALAGLLRYLARGTLEAGKINREMLSTYQEAAMLTDSAARRCLREFGAEICVSSHGLYTPYGVIGEACRTMGVRYTAWNVAYRKQCFIFSHGDTYHHTLLDEPVEDWENMPWSESKEEMLKSYLKSRITGANDWIWFFEKPQDDVAGMFSRLRVDRAKPAVLLLTNVLWDAQLHYRANAYPTMMDWIIDTVEYFKGRPDLQLIIRVHPAEMRPTLPSRQRVVDELQRMYGELPANVFVIGPAEQLSTYALAERCDSATIYGTKTGVELACMGIPVIVAGEAWVRGKGITHDATSRESYHQLLGAVPFKERLSPETRLRAYKYAYHFFFRRMIPVTAAKPVTSGWPPFQVVPDSLDALGPGADPGLDVICDGILTGREYVFDDPAVDRDIHRSP